MRLMLLAPTSPAAARPTGTTRFAQSRVGRGGGRRWRRAGVASRPATKALWKPNWTPVRSSGAGKWPRPASRRRLLNRPRRTESVNQAQMRRPTHRWWRSPGAPVRGRVSPAGPRRRRRVKDRRARRMRVAALSAGGRGVRWRCGSAQAAAADTARTLAAAFVARPGRGALGAVCGWRRRCGRRCCRALPLACWHAARRVPRPRTAAAAPCRHHACRASSLLFNTGAGCTSGLLIASRQAIRAATGARQAQLLHSTPCASPARSEHGGGPAESRCSAADVTVRHTGDPRPDTMAVVDPYADEPLLATNNERFCMFPIKCACLSRAGWPAGAPPRLCGAATLSPLTRPPPAPAPLVCPDPDVWEMYKKAEASFWTGACRGLWCGGCGVAQPGVQTTSCQALPALAPPLPPRLRLTPACLHPCQPRRWTWATTRSTGTSCLRTRSTSSATCWPSSPPPTASCSRTWPCAS